MSHGATAEVCEFHGDHGRIDERLEQLEDREDKQDTAIAELGKASSGIREELAGLRGEIRGALAASKLSGAIVGAIVSFAGSAAIALLLFLLGKR